MKMPTQNVKAPKVQAVKAPKTNAAKVNSAGMKRMKALQRGM